MSTPRWLREQRRWIKACERAPLRVVLPMPPHGQTVGDLRPNGLWTIPEPTTITTVNPRRPRRTR